MAKYMSAEVAAMIMMYGEGSAHLSDLYVTENGEYNPVPDEEDGFNKVTVAVPTYEEEYEAMLECFDDMADVIEEATGTRPADCEEAITAVEGIIEEKDQEKQRADEAEAEVAEYEECCENVKEHTEEKLTPEEQDEVDDIIEEHPEIEEHPDILVITEDIIGDDDFGDEVPIGNDNSPKKFIRLVGADCVVSWMIDYGEFDVHERDYWYRVHCSVGWPNVKITQTTVNFTTMTISKSTYTTGGWDTTNQAGFWGVDGRISDAEAQQLSDDEYVAYVKSYKSWFLANDWKTDCIQLHYDYDSQSQRRVNITFLQSSGNGGSYARDYYQSQWY